MSSTDRSKVVSAPVFCESFFQDMLEDIDYIPDADTLPSVRLSSLFLNSLSGHVSLELLVDPARGSPFEVLPMLQYHRAQWYVRLNAVMIMRSPQLTGCSRLACCPSRGT